MASTLEELAACTNDLLGIMPDNSVLCHDTSSATNADCFEMITKPEMVSVSARTTGSQRFDVQPSVRKLVADDLFGNNPHTCVLCDNLKLPRCDEKLHKSPIVDMAKPFMCIVCHKQFCTQEQLLTHSIMTCPGR